MFEVTAKCLIFYFLSWGNVALDASKNALFWQKLTTFGIAKIQSEFAFRWTRKEEGHLLLTCLSHFFRVQTASGSAVFLKFIRNPDRLKSECFAEWKAQDLKAVEVVMLRSRALCVARSRKGLPPLLSHSCTFLKRGVSVAKKQQLLLGSVFEASVVCRSESDSRKAEDFDLLSQPSAKVTELTTFSKMKLGLPLADVKSSQYLLPRIVSPAGDFKCLSRIRPVKG